jgi:hypothetical protein
MGKTSVFVDDAIPNGQNFSGAVRHSGLTFAARGTGASEFGVYTLSWATDTGTDSAPVTVGPAVVPLPAELALTGLGGRALLRRRKA